MTYRPLEDLRIARPCPARWDEMQGDDRVRFCGSCQKNVYNLSALSRAEAMRLVAEQEGKMCALLYRRPDGTVLTADCPVGRRAWAVRLVKRAAAVAAVLLMSLAGRYFTSAISETPPAEKPCGSSRPRPASARVPRYRPLSPKEQEEARELIGSLGYVSADPK